MYRVYDRLKSMEVTLTLLLSSSSRSIKAIRYEARFWISRATLALEMKM